MKRLFNARLALFLASILVSITLFAKGPWAPGSITWEFNPGPDPQTQAGREVIDIYADQPEYMDMSDELMDQQKFRYYFGLMMTRTYFEPDTVKILFIGQDATHVAEAAKQPGTSGFGGRVQSIGNFFGVDQGVATTNEFMSTIKGQYGSFDHPYVKIGGRHKLSIQYSSFVDNSLWMLANGRDSEVLIKREAFWEWMIKNNPESLKLIVTFGGASRDGFAEFLKGRGAKVGTKTDPEDLKYIRVPETKLVFAGGNNEFPVPVTKDGQDIYAILLKDKLKGKKPDYSKPEVQKMAQEALEEAGQEAIDMMVFTGGGVDGSGVFNAAQLGGYDLGDVEINGKKTNSLKGLVLSDGYVVKDDLAFATSIHPTMLSKMDVKQAAAALKKSFKSLLPLKKKGWRIEPDLDDNGVPRHNYWDEGVDPDYDRADIRPGYLEFGAPDDRRVSRAEASRLDPQTIIAGSRQRIDFDTKLIAAVKQSQPSDPKDPNDIWANRPRQKDTRYIFDRGPGEEIARAIITSIDRSALFAPKPGMKTQDKKGNDTTFDTHGIDAFYTKTHPGTGLFGFHRGTFVNPRALILADPQGLDDWNTARALTGERGQYLNGLMRDLGYGDQYLVIKTAPVGMDGATDEEWEYVRSKTEAYRDVALANALKGGTVEEIFTDGPIAQKEMERFLEKAGLTRIKVHNIKRDPRDLSAGIKEVARELGHEVSGKMADIPRSHLPWWARIWEGCGGDHVIDALGKGRGGVRALITPDWVAKQKVPMSARVTESIGKIKGAFQDAGLRLGSEPVKEFLARTDSDGKFHEIEMPPKKRHTEIVAEAVSAACKSAMDSLRKRFR